MDGDNAATPTWPSNPAMGSISRVATHATRKKTGTVRCGRHLCPTGRHLCPHIRLHVPARHRVCNKHRPACPGLRSTPSRVSCGTPRVRGPENRARGMHQRPRIASNPDGPRCGVHRFRMRTGVWRPQRTPWAPNRMDDVPTEVCQNKGAQRQRLCCIAGKGVHAQSKTQAPLCLRLRLRLYASASAHASAPASVPLAV